MNKAYKVIYNETTGTYVAVSELETSHGKATQSVVVKPHRTLLSENFHTPMGSFHCWPYEAV